MANESLNEFDTPHKDELKKYQEGSLSHPTGI